MICYAGIPSYHSKLSAFLICLPFIWAILATPSSGQSGRPGAPGEAENYLVRETGNPPVIDGSLDEPAWEQAARIPLGYERYPEPNAEPPVETRFYITYDEENLYVGFRAFDPAPGEIRAHLMDRDEQQQLNRDDHVGFTIDPFDNGEWGFQFRMNPLGVQADAVYSDRTGRTRFSWDAIWESAGSFREDGYEGEVRIPFSSINVPAAGRQSWRFQAFRIYPRSVRYRMVSHPVDLDNRSLMAQFGRLQGFNDLSGGLNMELNPVLTAKRTDEIADERNNVLEKGPVTFRPGGNIRWGIQPNLNLSATVNPDFSQVEADALQLRENERFVLSFPEKRPFFLESSEIFDTPFNAVFTRSIVDPDAGLKFTGKSDSHSFGTFVTRDRSSRLLFPANQGSRQAVMDRPGFSEIIRYRNSLSDKASLGLLAEGRQSENSGYHNFSGGVDGHLQFLNSNTLRFQYLRSSTQYTKEVAEAYDQPVGAFGGDALQVNLNHNSRHWQAGAGIETISSGFRNDNGFFPRADARTYRGGLQRILRGRSGGWYSSLRFGPAFEVTTNQAGTVTDQSYSVAASYSGPLQSQIYTEFNSNMQRFGGREFNGLNTGVLFFRLQPGDFLSRFRLYAAYGEEVDFANVRKSRELIIHPGLTFNVGRRLNVEVDPNLQRLSWMGETTFTTYLMGTRLVYHFDKRTFIRSIVQYRYVDRNLKQFNDPGAFDSSTEYLFYQLLFSYKINPQSKLFLGYSSGYGGTETRPLTIRNRTAFLKAGYAWVF